MVFIVGKRDQIFNYLQNQNDYMNDNEEDIREDIADIFYQIDGVFGTHENIYFVIEKNPNTNKFDYFTEGQIDVIKDDFLDMGEEDVIYLENQEGGKKKTSRKSKKKSSRKPKKNSSRKQKVTRKKLRSILAISGGVKKRKNKSKSKTKKRHIRFGKSKKRYYH